MNQQPPEQESNELHIICEEDCGNAPRKHLLRAFTTAIVTQAAEPLLPYLADNTQWERVGVQSMQGKDAIVAAIQDQDRKPATLLQIHHILTHGGTAAIDGIVHTADQSQYAFCDVYSFRSAGKNAKIKSITSYWIPLM